jgi:replicative DNA helicase
MKELTKEQLEQKMKEHKQKVQLILVNDILDKMEHLANITIKDDYEPSYEETQKILQIKRYADTILKNIG